MNAPRRLIAAGAVLFAAGLLLGWLDGTLGSVPAHHLLEIGGWAYLPLVPVLLAPLAPARWLLPLAAAWLLALAVAIYVAATAGEIYPAWPYGGDVESAHPGVFVSIAGVVAALGGTWWALGHEAGPLTTRRWVDVVCRGEIDGGPNCAYRIERPDGSGEAGSLSATR